MFQSYFLYLCYYFSIQDDTVPSTDLSFFFFGEVANKGSCYFSSNNFAGDVSFFVKGKYVKLPHTEETKAKIL